MQRLFIKKRHRMAVTLLAGTISYAACQIRTIENNSSHDSAQEKIKTKETQESGTVQPKQQTPSAKSPKYRWEYSGNGRHKKVKLQSNQTILNVEAFVTLGFNCHDSDNDPIMQLIVGPTSKMPAFRFGFFEGKNAPAAVKKLVTLKIEGQKEYTLKTRAGGYHSGEVEDAFVFNIWQENNDLTEVLKLLSSEESKIYIVVVDYEDSSLKIEAQFVNNIHEPNALSKVIECAQK